MPIVLINGDKDAVAPVASGRKCAEAAPDGRLEIIADCGHLIVLDQKAALHALISDEAAVMPARAGVAT